MIKKVLGIDYLTNYLDETQGICSLAITLTAKSVTDQYDVTGVFTRTHESGWTITGEVIEDYYHWVNDFEATHPIYGTVKGNFEEFIEVDCEEGFKHFMEHHEPEIWDYYDI